MNEAELANEREPELSLPISRSLQMSRNLLLSQSLPLNRTFPTQCSVCMYGRHLNPEIILSYKLSEAQKFHSIGFLVPPLVSVSDKQPGFLLLSDWSFSFSVHLKKKGGI